MSDKDQVPFRCMHDPSTRKEDFRLCRLSVADRDWITEHMKNPRTSPYVVARRTSDFTVLHLSDEGLGRCAPDRTFILHLAGCTGDGIIIYPFQLATLIAISPSLTVIYTVVDITPIPMALYIQPLGRKRKKLCQIPQIWNNWMSRR